MSEPHDSLIEFQDIVMHWVALGGERSLAVEMEVAISTTRRWVTGTARPHPFLQKQVIAWIRSRVA